MAVTEIEQEYQVAIGDLVMGPGTDYIVHGIDGFGSPDIRASDSPRPAADGYFHGQDFLGMRTMTVSLTVRGDTAADVVANVDALMAAWRPLRTGTTALRFMLPGTSERIVVGRPRRAAPNMTRVVGRRAPMTLEFVCADPRIYSAEMHQVSTGLAFSTNGRTYPRTYPLTYGGIGEGGIITATNAGSFDSFPIMTIDGPATDPRIENLTTGETFLLNYVLGSGESLTIDFDARTVLLNGSSSRYYAVDRSSVWFPIEPGSNALRFRAATYQAQAALRVAWRDAWL